MKKCPKCKRYLDSKYFYSYDYRSDGLSSYCKICCGGRITKKRKIKYK